MQQVPICPLPLRRFAPLIGERGAERLQAAVQHASAMLQRRTVWHVSSTREGGGVAEMLQTLLGYERGAGLDARWLVIDGDPEFFTLTKRLHHRLHGRNGDGLSLASAEHHHYRAILGSNAEELLQRVRPRDVVILHDPQTAGLAPAVRQIGALVVWRCHIGRDRPNGVVASAWGFLRPYLEHAHAFVFSRACYVPRHLAPAPAFVIPPAIDAFSAKNRPMGHRAARSVLAYIGILDGQPVGRDLGFRRQEGAQARIRRRAEVVQTAPVPADVPLVVQVSRWDPLKDMGGVMQAFAQGRRRLGDAHLVLAGPAAHGVADDPEGASVLDRCVARWHRLSPSERGRVHLAILPTADVEENALMVNALQRYAAVVTQKSLQEGFGLTVTEAMWKGRPIVASGVGGIQDQIVHGVHGLLLDDPSDGTAFARAAGRLLADRGLARRLGRNAHRRARTHFLGPAQLTRFVRLLCVLEGRRCRELAA